MTLVQKNIRRIIVEKALLKKGVAKRAGFSQQQFSDIVCGRKTIKADMIPMIAFALGVQIDELFKNIEKGA